MKDRKEKCKRNKINEEIVEGKKQKAMTKEYKLSKNKLRKIIFTVYIDFFRYYKKAHFKQLISKGQCLFSVCLVFQQDLV